MLGFDLFSGELATAIAGIVELMNLAPVCVCSNCANFWRVKNKTATQDLDA